MKKTVKKFFRILLVIILALILIPIILFFIMRIKNTFQDRITPENGIQESVYLDRNGIKQYIQIRGEDVDNPVMIFIHGGPAQPMTYYSSYYQKDLESEVTIINYDQRGCGRTYYANDNDANSNIELLLSDLNSIVEYTKERFKKDKVIIAGHSWGSVLGTMYVQEYPENVMCYIGISQVTNLMENKLTVAQTALETDAIKGTEDETLLREVKERLSKVNSYEELNLADLSLLSFVLSAKYIGCEEEGSGIGIWEMLTSPDMNFNDFKWLLKTMDVSFFDETKQVMEYALFGFDIANLSVTYEVPVYYIAGEGDYVVGQKDVQKYYEQINAPDKEFYMLENVGHNMMVTNPKIYCDTIKQILNRGGF